MSTSSFSGICSFLIPPVSASVAIIPTFYGFVAKSALQLGEPIPRMHITKAMTRGVKVAPTIGAIVGIQMATQNIVEKVLKKQSVEQNQKGDFAAIMISSFIVGGISAPSLAVFNGQTMGKTVLESLKSLNFKQAGAIVTRETSFVFSLRFSDPLSLKMKLHFGDNHWVEYGSAFASGAIGAIVGHPPDTALTIWQIGKKIVKIRPFITSALVRVPTVGIFSVLFKLTSKTLNGIKKE